MIYVCVICMVKRPPLSPLSPEYRTLLEAIVSSVINTEELKGWHWLHCADCKVLMHSVYNFQQTALAGINNLKYLFRELNKAETITAGTNTKVPNTTPKWETFIPVCIQEEDYKVPFKIEPEPEVVIPILKKEIITATTSRNADPLTAPPLDVKSEPESCSEPDLEPKYDSEATLSCESDHDVPNSPLNTYTSAPSTDVVSKLPTVPVKSVEKCEVFTHGRRPRHLTCIRWKGGVGELIKRSRKEYYKPVKAVCPHCGRIMYKSSVKKHIARMHAELETCECDVCGKQCRNQTVLKSHKTYMHSEADPAAFCLECNIQCRSLYHYKKHLQTTNRHATETDYRYKCDECGRKFVTEANLQSHSKTHMDTKYPCDQCGHVLKSDNSRRIHIRNKHESKVPPRKRLICDYCGKCFGTKVILSSHINTHTGARPFVCKLCGADFGHKSALYLHGRYKHKIPRKKEKGKVINKNSEKDNSTNDHSEKSSVDIVKDKEDKSSSGQL